MSENTIFSMFLLDQCNTINIDIKRNSWLAFQTAKLKVLRGKIKLISNFFSISLTCRLTYYCPCFNEEQQYRWQMLSIKRVWRTTRTVLIISSLPAVLSHKFLSNFVVVLVLLLELFNELWRLSCSHMVLST